MPLFSIVSQLIITLCCGHGTSCTTVKTTYSDLGSTMPITQCTSHTTVRGFSNFSFTFHINQVLDHLTLMLNPTSQNFINIVLDHNLPVSQISLNPPTMF